MKGSRAPVLSEVFDTSTLKGRNSTKDLGDGKIHPESLLVHPIYENFDTTGDLAGDVVGTIIAVMPWGTYLTNLLHDDDGEVVCVVRDTCGDVFTYVIDGPQATYWGEGDLHDTRYDNYEYVVAFGVSNEKKYVYEDKDDATAHCIFSLHVFPTVVLESSFQTSNPIIYTTVVILIFAFTTLVFLLYDCSVQRRQDRVQSAAMKSDAIVSSLFPAEVRDRLFQNSSVTERAKGIASFGKYNLKSNEPAAKSRLKSFLDNDHAVSTSATTDDKGSDGEVAIPEMYETRPIADLFLNTTVMFADISGFTAWSSVREPSQVFMLLETVYRAFDMLAKHRRVFKVETVGDCYVSYFGVSSNRVAPTDGRFD